MSDVLKLAKKELPDDGTAKMSNLLIVRAHFSEIKKNAAIGVRIVPLTSVDTKTVVPLSCLTKARIAREALSHILSRRPVSGTSCTSITKRTLR